MSFRWEEELRESFLENATPELWCKVRKVKRICSLKESTCSEGRADWVWANVDFEQPMDGTASSLLEQPACSRILAALQSNRRMALDGLRAFAGVTIGTLKRHMDALISANLIRSARYDEFTLGKAFKVPPIEICSFEFKLENWTRAFQQSKRYRSFSHRVYVVMPLKAAERAMRDEETFKKFNVGLISHEPCGNSTRLVLSRKTLPTSPTSFIQAVGLLMRHEAKPARRAKSAIPRRQLCRCCSPVNRLNSIPSRSRIA